MDKPSTDKAAVYEATASKAEAGFPPKWLMPPP